MLTSLHSNILFLRNLVRERGAPALHYKKRGNDLVNKENRTRRPYTTISYNAECVRRKTINEDGLEIRRQVKTWILFFFTNQLQ
jgi:hypothetical protein